MVTLSQISSSLDEMAKFTPSVSTPIAVAVTVMRVPPELPLEGLMETSVGVIVAAR